MLVRRIKAYTNSEKGVLQVRRSCNSDALFAMHSSVCFDGRLVSFVNSHYPMQSKVRRKLAAPESYYNVEGRYKARAIPSVPANSIALQHE